jgi:hypothetical protein
VRKPGAGPDLSNTHVVERQGTGWEHEAARVCLAGGCTAPYFAISLGRKSMAQRLLLNRIQRPVAQGGMSHGRQGSLQREPEEEEAENQESHNSQSLETESTFSPESHRRTRLLGAG